MDNLEYRNHTYKNIFKYSDDILIKYSSLDYNLWNELNKKHLSYINNPIKVEEVTKEEKKLYRCNSKVYLPFLKDYKTFYYETFTKNLSTKEILMLMKKNLLILKTMHSNNVIHTDIHSDNLMINKDLNIKFIDFDYAIINNEPIPLEDEFLSKREYMIKRAVKRNLDKVDILDMYMYYLVNGDFRKDITSFTNIESLKLQKYIKEEINTYISLKRKPNRNYYFIDIINELISSGFESNVLELRKVNNNV